MKKILVIGAGGQIGSELVVELRKRFGADSTVASDIREPQSGLSGEGPFEVLDVMDNERLKEIVAKHEIKEVYLLAALLSATAEKNPEFAWKLNMEGLFNVLNLAKEGVIKKVFWPSSIAVFGPTTPKKDTPQLTIMEPSTVYGISKLAGERWCEYYANQYGVDVRSIRYPGLLSYTTLPGGGTTDYAVDIFYSAKKNEPFSCFLKEDTALPMMYMADAIRATVDLMEAPDDSIKIRSSYNLAGISFTPKEIYEAVKKLNPDFTIEYNPDFRQQIADSWPGSIDDSAAQTDWGWNPEYDLESTAKIMFDNVLTEVHD
ncbi:MAG: NAD-dependent epimerase/dehydratase family protein [Flavobacteriales bacterium]|nr:NAD-dependent epimerase/dehydratase family protein [Flavobacteriales bacterium]